MNSLEKRHTGQRGNMQGHRKHSDGFSDTSSSSSFMDDTDREVSNLTDRAFRSLCIGEEAIYNDSEFCLSPNERHKAFAEETQQGTVTQEAFSYSVQQHGEAESQSEMASTFQNSYVDVTQQELTLTEGSLSYTNNGSKEVTWQQGRSASRVSSLIKAFSSGECYHDSGTCNSILPRDRYRDFSSESWDKSDQLSIQRELSEFSTGYHQNFKSDPYQSNRKHFYSSQVAAAVAQMKSSKSKSKALNTANGFFHSEFSPFQLWEDYNRFPFESMNVSEFLSASEFPRWYDSPMYKELKDNPRVPNSPCEGRRFCQRQIHDVVASQRSRSTVVQKASAIEKRCESEMASNCPPWKKNNNFIRNKLPSNRPCTVSPTNERTCRPDSNLYSNSKIAHDTEVEGTLPSSVTPFNITQLLTPVIHTRQETETSEILQFAHTPSVSDYSSQGETDANLQTDIKHLRDSYKSKASSLLFNLKDNRKRVKSTYSPTRFKGLEITDQNKQTSKLEGRESRFSDILVSQEMAQEHFIGTAAHASCNQIGELSASPMTLKDYNGGFGSYDNLTLTSPRIQDTYKLFSGNSEGHSDLLANTEPSTRNLSAQDKSQLKDFNCSFSLARPEIAYELLKAYPSMHSLPAQTSEQNGQSFTVSQNDLKQRNDFGVKTFTEYSKNEAVRGMHQRDQTGSVKNAVSKPESHPFRGEIAALIEMDKQRKATAKQYSSKDGYSLQKETYMQKVNEDIKLGRLAKEEERDVKEEAISPRKMSCGVKTVLDNKLNTYTKLTESYEMPKHSLQNKTSPLKEVYCGIQSFSVKNELDKQVPDQSAPYNTISNAPLKDDKGQKNEVLYSWPYMYAPNKQWHMASSGEDGRNTESIWAQKQSETMEPTGGARSYKISNTLSSTQHTNQNELSTNSDAEYPDMQGKVSVLLTDNSDQNNATKQEDRFSINDILAYRDNEQARRLKDNTFTLDKLHNNQIKYDAADKLTITEPVKEQHDYKMQDVKSPVPAEKIFAIPKEFHNKTETNISVDTKDRFMSKDADKVSTRQLSYKEKGQSKQEMLTSKLKAHAQKEISAIKEKGLAKQGILARNASKTSVTINNDGQEGISVKKEITADKLNHLFQDITYSSVTQYKEQMKTHNHPKNASPPTAEKPLHFESNHDAVLEKKGENVKHNHSAIERQNDKDPSDDEEKMKGTFTLDGQATVAEMDSNLQKNYRQPRISEDEQKHTKISQDKNTDKESAKQNLELLQTELMSGNITEAVKMENCASHNTSGLHHEKQTIVQDHKDSLNGNSQSPYKYSEKAVKSKTAEITKNELQVTSNSSSNNSLRTLETSTPRVEEANVHNKVKITAAVEQSKNEPIKNSTEITASQLTSSSSDQKFKNGIPPAKQLMEPAKSELTSNLQTNSLSAEAEELINRNYKRKPGFISYSEALSTENTKKMNSVPARNTVSQRPRELETLKHLDTEDGQPLMIKNKTTNENNLTKQQRNPEENVEITHSRQMVDTKAKPGINRESQKQIASVKPKESCQQVKLHQEDTKTLLSFDTNELPGNLSQQQEKGTESTIIKQKEQELEISNETIYHKPTQESQEVNRSNSTLNNPAQNEIESTVSSQHKVIVHESPIQKNNTPPISTQNVESTTDASNILAASTKEYNEEPMIYSICVSTKTEATSEDEPMIFSICVSSKCHTDEQLSSAKSEEEHSIESDKCVNSIKNDGTEKVDNHRKADVHANNEEILDNTEKCGQQRTMDKSSTTGGISTSYDDLLAKYGFQVREYSHVMSKRMQGEREARENRETEAHPSHKPLKHGISRHLRNKEKLSDDTQAYKEDSRQASAQHESITSQPLNEAESKSMQEKAQQNDTTSMMPSNNMVETQPKVVHSTRDDTLIRKDIENVEENTHNNESSGESRRNDFQSMEKKVEQQVTNSEKIQSERKGNIIDVSNPRKSPENTNNVPLTDKQTFAMATEGELIKATKTEDLRAPIYNGSMAKDKVSTKFDEVKVLGKTIHQAIRKPQGEEGEIRMPNHTDTFERKRNKTHGRETFNLNVEKAVLETKQDSSIMAMKKESVSHKDAQTLQNNEKGDFMEKRVKEKFECNTSNDAPNKMKLSKDGTVTHVNNYKDKVSHIGEDVVKHGQTSFEVPKIHLEDIKVSKEEVPSNKEFMAGHKKQHEVLKWEHLKGEKEATMARHEGEKEFTEQKLPLKAITASNERKPSEMAVKHAYEFGKAIIPPKKDGPSGAKMAENNLRQGEVQTQEKEVYENKSKKDPVSGQNVGDSKVNDKRSSFRENGGKHVEETKHKDWSNANPYQPGRSFVPETKGSASYEQEHAQPSQKDMNTVGIVSKSEAPQKNKVTRPEISAIADYARLKVISAEGTKDLDIFPNIDFYKSNNQSVSRIQKDTQVNASDTGRESEREVSSREKSQNLLQTLQFKKQTNEETLSQKYTHLNHSISTVQPKPASPLTLGSQATSVDIKAQSRALNNKEANTKPSFVEHPNIEEMNEVHKPINPHGAEPLRVEGRTSRSKTPKHDKTSEKGSFFQSGRLESLGNLSSSDTINPAHNQTNMASPLLSSVSEETEEIPYYTVNALETELKSKETLEASSPRVEISQNQDLIEKTLEEKKESLFLQSLSDYGKVHATGQQSSSSSPAMGKPIMFRVKDNTMRTSSVTKTVKPRFHRSFSDDFRIGSPKEDLSGSEKDYEMHPKESPNSPVSHKSVTAVQQLQNVKDTLQNSWSLSECNTKQPKRHHRRSQNFEEEDARSVISTMSEDLENHTASPTDVANMFVAFMPRNESYRDAYQRPASACYERPESACYERPQSACSDMRSLGKPPTVPPKSEKALRRAQRLTTRRLKKAETPIMPPENLDQQESNSFKEVLAGPSSPSDTLSTHLEVQASPPLSQYDIQPSYTPAAHSIVAQPFPMTQRKLLQDPNSGQYFMVDVPLSVKTKTFYDPETGKYVHLNVRQRSLTQPAPVEVLNAPYMLYRGFLPVAASSLPPMRSSSEMSTPAMPTDTQGMHETGSEHWRQNVYLQNHSIDAQESPEMVYRPHEQIHYPALYSENGVINNERHTDIITMSELEDFAMEST